MGLAFASRGGLFCTRDAVDKLTSGSGKRPADEGKIAALSNGLVAAYGAEACDIVQAQIDGAESDEARATWIAIWERICAPKARRA